MAFTDVPRIPLFQPWLDVAMQKNVTRVSLLVFIASSITGNWPRPDGARSMIALRRLATALPVIAGVIVATFLLTRARH
jgi:hypothetical protein